MEKWFSAQGSPRPQYCTITEYRMLLEAKYPNLAPQVAVITDRFTKVRYSSIPVTRDDSFDVYDACRFIYDFRETRNR